MLILIALRTLHFTVSDILIVWCYGYRIQTFPDLLFGASVAVVAFCTGQYVQQWIGAELCVNNKVSCTPRLWLDQSLWPGSHIVNKLCQHRCRSSKHNHWHKKYCSGSAGAGATVASLTHICVAWFISKRSLVMYRLRNSNKRYTLIITTS